MQAQAYGSGTAMYAAANRRHFMPGSASEQPRQSASAASKSGTTFIAKTDVLTSVSLFVLAIIISNILAPVLLVVGLVAEGIVVLSSLILTGLTGLVGLESLVGHKHGMATRTAQGV